MDAKICTQCRFKKPVSEFGKHKLSKDGLRSQCKSCIRDYQLKRYHAQKQVACPLTTETQRTCRSCGLEKPIGEFNKQKLGKGGRRSQCRICLTAYRRSLGLKYKANPELPASGSKSCNKCKRELAVTEFPVNNANKSALASYCKQCCKDRNRRRKIEIFSHYCDGELHCACCGETELDFLTLDHANNDGAEHRRQVGGAGVTIYCWIKRNNYPDGFAVLCMNCNFARWRFGICPHQSNSS